MRSAAVLSSVPAAPEDAAGGEAERFLRGETSDCARARNEVCPLDPGLGIGRDEDGAFSGGPNRSPVGDPDPSLPPPEPSMNVNAFAASTSCRVVVCVECEWERFFFSPSLNWRKGDAAEWKAVELLRR